MPTLVFTRDRDASVQRQNDVREALTDAVRELQRAPPVVGGVAVERIESWVLAAKGVLEVKRR